MTLTCKWLTPFLSTIAVTYCLQSQQLLLFCEFGAASLKFFHSEFARFFFGVLVNRAGVDCCWRVGKVTKTSKKRSRRTGLVRACQYDVYLYNTAWRLHTFRMGNGLGSFVYQLQCHGLQPWGLCLVLESSFLYSWTIFRNRDRRQVWIYSNWPSDPGDYVTPRDLLTPPLSGSGRRGRGYKKLKMIR